MKASSRRCPICGKAADPKARWSPFCGKRCRTQDLANWSTGTYSIPGPVTEADEHLDPYFAPPEGAPDD